MGKVGKAKENNLKPLCTFYTSFEFIVVLFDQLMKKSKKEKEKKVPSLSKLTSKYETVFYVS